MCDHRGKRRRTASTDLSQDPPCKRRQELERASIASITHKFCSYCGEKTVAENWVEVRDEHGSRVKCAEKVVQTGIYKVNFLPVPGNSKVSLEELATIVDQCLQTAYASRCASLTTGDATWCSIALCGAYVCQETQSKEMAACKVCDQKTCTKCKKAEHAGHCFKTHIPLELELLARENKWQRCVNCGSLVELVAGGCAHIKCLCGADFCYTCGKPWKSCPCSTGVAKATIAEDTYETRLSQLREENPVVARRVSKWHRATRRTRTSQCQPSFNKEVSQSLGKARARLREIFRIKKDEKIEQEKAQRQYELEIQNNWERLQDPKPRQHGFERLKGAWRQVDAKRAQEEQKRQEQEAFERALLLKQEAERKEEARCHEEYLRQRQLQHEKYARRQAEQELRRAEQLQRDHADRQELYRRRALQDQKEEEERKRRAEPERILKMQKDREDAAREAREQAAAARTKKAQDEKKQRPRKQDFVKEFVSVAGGSGSQSYGNNKISSNNGLHFSYGGGRCDYCHDKLPIFLFRSRKMGLKICQDCYNEAD